jgi:tetratricopeptide (TPR) repeat protein
MSKRPAAVLLLAVVVAVFPLEGCSTRDQYVEGRITEAREHAQRREYDRAHAVLDAALTRAPGDVTLLMEKADIFMRAHRYEDAAAWYSEAEKEDPESALPVVGRWEAERALVPENDAASERILQEAGERLAEAPDSLANLTAAIMAHRMLGAEDAAADAVARLVALYPDSELGSELIKEDVDAIGVERDDDTRLSMADEFLDAYPETKWRPGVLRLKLITLRRLGRCEDVQSVGREWVAACPDDGEVLDIVASALVSCARAADEAAGLARRAIELELSDTERSASKSDLTLASRGLTLARALVLAGDFAGALEAVDGALESLRTGADEEETGSAWHFTRGQAFEGMDRFEDALDAYLAAVIAGGRQNRWPSRADTALFAIYDREFAARAGGSPLEEFARRLVDYRGPVFTDVTSSAGLGDRGETRLAWGDYDGDGRDDLLLSGRVLMRNTGAGTFVDVTEAAGIGGTGANGGVWADVDNDGDLDFYATSGATSGDRTDRLWLNGGDGTFSDATESAGGMTDSYTTEGAAWGDYDGDGLADLYLASYERPRDEAFDEYGVGYPDLLYRNLGDGAFAEVSGDAGIMPPFGEHLSGRGVNWGDYDNDGDLDIFVSNYRLQENFLWRNEGDGSFTNVAPELGVSGAETDGWWGHTIGSEWGDYDNDGDLDLFCANLAHPRYIEVSDMSMLYRNALDDDGRFRDRRADAGVKYAETHSDPSWGDVDLDGDLDLFVTSIYPDCGSFLYLNDGLGNFEDVTWLAGVRAFNGWGTAMCDYDLDGDLDIAVASGDGFRLFRNDGPAGPRWRGSCHWLAVRCRGTRSNAAGIGARVTVVSGSRLQIREIEGGKGTTSQHAMTAFFGLGPRGAPVDVEVRFLGGAVETFEDVEVDQLITIVEPG